MVRFILSSLLSLFSMLLMAQQPLTLTATRAPLGENEALNKTFSAYTLYDMPSALLKAHLQQESNGEKQVRLVLPGIGEWPLALVPSNLLTEDYALRLDDGNKIVVLPGPGEIAWKGRVEGSSQSDVRLTVNDGFIFGSIQVGASTWFIEPLKGLVAGSPADRYLVYLTSDVRPDPALHCGVQETEEHRVKPASAPQKAENQVGLCKHVELAIASAYDMYTRYDNNVTTVQNHNIGVMNGVGTDYDNTFDDEIYFLIATQYVSTTSTSSLDVALTTSTDASTLLNNFTTWGNAGNFGVTYDLGQLWTSRNICFGSNCGTVGLAWVGAVCTNNRYHILEDWNGYNSSGSGWQLRVMTSHEIGHNFNCSHLPSNTIMKGTVNETTTWSDTSRNQVNAYLPTISCLAICGTNFQATAYTTSEGLSDTYLGGGSPTCDIGYTELSIPLFYSGSANGGSVTISAVGGTATEYADFDIPNSTINIPSGSTSQIVNAIIRIWNDAISEGDETINLELSGTQAGSNNTATVTIKSDDLDPATNYLRYGQIGSGNAGNISVPFYGSQSDARTQFIYSASELTSAGFAANDVINGLALEITSKGSTQPYTNLTIKMKHTSTNTSSTGQPENSGFTTVYSSTYTTATGWSKFEFSSGFLWNGTNNVRVEVCYDNTSGTANDLVSTNTGGATVFISSTSGSGCTLPTNSWSYYGSNRPNIRLYKGYDIAATLNDEADTHLKAGQTAYFKDAQNQFILTVKQNSGTDIGCINVKIDRAGTGRQSPAWLPGKYITDKTFLITADNPNVPYDITLYYSKAEMTVWGTSASSLNILKSTGPISDANATNSSINTSVTRSTFGPSGNTDAYRSYKATFSSFSGFALTDATTVAPVEWLSFSGQWREKTAALTWSTAAELNNKGFEVERSADGLRFDKIGFVAGRGTISQPQPYTFDDDQAYRSAASVLYYRLRQVDHDGTASYSTTVALAKPGSGTAYALFPNPSSGAATFQLLGCDDCSATLTLSDASGRLVRRLLVTSPSTALDLSDLPAGVYLADIEMAEGGRWQTRVVKW
ncbi:MAG TPA: M12 family metallo-peptidase [Saprospiraceae bacterium]|nr:M12 family metallo-peptidase [Saprospiraceae bacterium]